MGRRHTVGGYAVILSFIILIALMSIRKVVICTKWLVTVLALEW